MLSLDLANAQVVTLDAKPIAGYASPRHFVPSSPGLYKLVPSSEVRLATGRLSEMGTQHVPLTRAELIEPVLVSLAGISFVSEVGVASTVYIVPVVEVCNVEKREV